MDHQFGQEQCKLGWGRNAEAGEKSAYKNVQVGGATTEREIGSPIPTNNASWRGPNIEKLGHQIQQTMQVGVGHR
ncbi:hypothetical protein ACVPOQ_15055 [Staphylococcus aureus]